MMEEDEIPYGYIYRATNRQTGKNYIGQTISSRWKEDQNPIEERWKEEVQEAYRKEKKAEDLRYIEKAITKYGPENFEVKEQDVAYSQEELDEKETQYIQDYDSMNPDKGYNLREGGLGGRLSEEAKENISNVIKEKYQEDTEYYNKQVEERRERANDLEWVEKMTEINQQIARNPETQEKMSKVMKERWKDSTYQENVSQGVKDLWQKAGYRSRQLRARTEGKREIEDKGELLKDIQEMSKKEINIKYDMDGKCINRRIKEMLGHRGVNNYSEAKKYLEDKDLNQVLKDINERQINQLESKTIKKVISNKEEFLKDIQNMQKKEISEKYGMNETTVNKRIQEMLGDQGVHNYTDAKTYLEGKNLNEVLKDINERLNNQSERYIGKTVISDKEEFLRDIQNMQKNEMVYKYDMDGKTINRKIEEMLGEQGVENYSQAKEYLKEREVDDFLKEIDERESNKQDGKGQLENMADDNREISRIKSEDQFDEEKSKENIEELREESRKELGELQNAEKVEKISDGNP